MRDSEVTEPQHRQLRGKVSRWSVSQQVKSSGRCIAKRITIFDRERELYAVQRRSGAAQGNSQTDSSLASISKAKPNAQLQSVMIVYNYPEMQRLEDA